MRLNSCLVLVLTAAALWATPAAAGVKVNFADTKTFTDLDARSGIKRELRASLQRLGAQLDPGLNLTVTFLDINVAGIESLLRGPSAPRILTGATPPSMTLRYVLSRKGKTIASGEEFLSDQFYLSRPGARSGDPLIYEKKVLNDWFATRFASHLKTGG